MFMVRCALCVVRREKRISAWSPAPQRTTHYALLPF